MDSYHKDLAVRRWAAERGGVYVPLDAKTPPNPYLAHRPDRDITTTQGKVLTLVNPAHMARMVHELGESAYGLRGHLTSLKPLRPENAPDAWERTALTAFEHGTRAYSEVLQEKGKPILRFMGAFTVETSCLPCHARQGYKVGDVRGGISVSVPVGSHANTSGLSHETTTILAVLGFWVIGGIGILVWLRRLLAFSRQQQRLLVELEDSASRFRLLFDSSPAPMTIFRNGRITHANTAAAWLLEARIPEELVGRNILELVHPDFHQIAVERLRILNQEGHSTAPMKELLVTLQGHQVWAEVQSVPLELPEGPAILVFAQDLTDQRRAAEDRLKLETEVQHAQKLESLGSLAGGIAHDMNNVLGAVLGMASLLQLKHEGDAPLLKALGTIEHAASRGRDLVKGLTDFARKGLQEPQVLDLNELVRKEVDLLVRTSRQRFTFDIQLEEGLPAIMGEPSTLGSAFMNLCVNAFDAMPRGGSLIVRTHCEGRQVSLLVADTGEGIPADILPRVTDPFFTTKPVGRGTGLGLAMVYGAMKAHGGSLDIQSEVGKGTRISLRFPAVAIGAALGPLAAATESSPGRPLRVLLVDDDELIRSTLPHMLEQLGHRVETASGGLEAIRRLSAGMEADLVILDHNMPGLSGADTLPRILQARPDLQILIATGFQDTELKILLSGFPSVLTLQKPFSMAELRQVLQGV